jgi:hypothetical protein
MRAPELIVLRGVISRPLWWASTAERIVLDRMI